MDSIGETYSEYLVNFDMFVSIMKGNGLNYISQNERKYDIFDGPLNSFDIFLKT